MWSWAQLSERIANGPEGAVYCLIGIGSLLRGIVMIRWSEPIGVGFPRIGSAPWEIGTPGLWDGAAVYDEDSAPGMFGYPAFGVFVNGRCVTAKALHTPSKAPAARAIKRALRS